MSVKNFVQKWDQNSANFYTEMENLAKKPRFGVFNHPPSMVVGDTSYGKHDATHTSKNFLTNQRYGDGYFSKPQYHGDDFEDPFKVEQRAGLMKTGVIDPPFKPSDAKKTKVRAPYEYLSETSHIPKNLRDSNGSVTTGPKNFLTRPLKKGSGNTTYGHLFSSYQYVEDPYDRAREQDLKEWINHKSKMLSNRPFVSNNARVKTFDSDAKVFQWRPHTSMAGGHGGNGGDVNGAGVAGDGGRGRSASKMPFVVSKVYRPRTSEGGWRPMIHGDGDGDVDGMISKEELMERYRRSMTKAWKPNFNGTLERPTPSMTEKFNRMHKTVRVGQSFKF